ncbi:hypothetical protein KY312_00250, partial [Candidatus Woesearchaeota archaeon]|nr:hypothetical protein [Candidatus Woesearchaeota archaeon]
RSKKLLATGFLLGAVASYLCHGCIESSVDFVKNAPKRVSEYFTSRKEHNVYLCDKPLDLPRIRYYNNPDTVAQAYDSLDEKGKEAFIKNLLEKR